MVGAQLARSCRLLGAVMVAGAIPLAFGVAAASASASGVTLDPTVPGLPALPPITVPAPPSGGSVPPALPGGGDPAPPTLPPGLTPPVTTVPPLSPPSPPGGGGTPTDPCAQSTGPMAAQGAPISATCPITPTSDGGVDVPLCIDIAQQPSCSTAKSTGTTTTTTKLTTNANGSGDNSGSSGSGDPSGSASGSNPSSSSGAISPASARHSGGTLPFTGGEGFVLMTAGSALAGAGAALARAARRRGLTL